MLKNKIAANLMITIILVGLITGISINAFQSKSSLVVYAANNVPVSGASISASGTSGNSGSGVATANAQGQYNITSFLDTGNYSVVASAPGFIDQQVDNIAVTAGAETSNVNIIMNVSGGISGKVTDAVSGSPLSGVIVTAYSTTGTGSQSAFTDANGSYQIIQNLPSGTYNVNITLATGYLYKTVSSVFVVAGIMTSNINFALSKSGVIVGIVTDSVSHAVLAGILVVGINSNGNYATYSVTNSTGQYTLNTNLPTGLYNVTITFPTGYVSKTVSSVSVTAGQTTSQNIALDPSGVISGKVTNTANGQPISGVSITAVAGTSFGSATTNSNGNYNISSGLGTGTYTVIASIGTSFAINSSVNVVASQVTSNVNFQLTVTIIPSGTISGKVTNTTAAPISFAYVNAQGAAGSGSNYTDSNGNYIISGLSPGTYTVNVTTIGYISQQQTGISVIINQVTSNVNFVLTAMPSGRISGQVLSSQANPFPPIPEELSIGAIVVLSVAAVLVGSRYLVKPPKVRNSNHATT